MTEPVRIPADVDRPDRVLGNLTARQLAILLVAAAALYLAWIAARPVLPPLVFLGAAAPIAAVAATLALGSRDGISLDRLAVAAVRQRVAPTHRITAPEGVHPPPAWLAGVAANPVARAGGRLGGGQHGGGQVSPVPLRLPAEAVRAAAGQVADAGQTGVVDLGADGLAVVAVCSTVNFALRTPVEQESLVGVFGRWLHSLTGATQILVRAERLDLSGQVAELRERAPGLPHPALEAAAVEHADYLTQLAAGTDLLRRQVLLILREPLPGAGAPNRTMRPGHRGRRDASAGRDAVVRAAETRLARRLAEAGELLAPAGVAVTGLDPAQASSVLAAACNPDNLIPPGAALAAADDIITTRGTDASGAAGPTDPDGDWPYPASAAGGGLAGLLGEAGSDHDQDDDHDDDEAEVAGSGGSHGWPGRWVA